MSDYFEPPPSHALPIPDYIDSGADAARYIQGITDFDNRLQETMRLRSAPDSLPPGELPPRPQLSRDDALWNLAGRFACEGGDERLGLRNKGLDYHDLKIQREAERAAEYKKLGMFKWGEKGVVERRYDELLAYDRLIDDALEVTRALDAENRRLFDAEVVRIKAELAAGNYSFERTEYEKGEVAWCRHCGAVTGRIYLAPLTADRYTRRPGLPTTGGHILGHRIPSHSAARRCPDGPKGFAVRFEDLEIFVHDEGTGGWEDCAHALAAAFT